MFLTRHAQSATLERHHDKQEQLSYSEPVGTRTMVPSSRKTRGTMATDDEVELWLADRPENQQAALQELREVLRNRLPTGFSEVVHGTMLAYVVPHTLYPAGYHANPEQPLPFISLAGPEIGHFALSLRRVRNARGRSMVPDRVPEALCYQTRHGQELYPLQEARPNTVRPHR